MKSIQLALEVLKEAGMIIESESGYTFVSNDNKNVSNSIVEPIIEPKKCFRPPTLEEVKAYCKERANNINAEQFINHYEARGWMLGKVKVKNWKACIRTWETNGYNTTLPKPNIITTIKAPTYKIDPKEMATPEQMAEFRKRMSKL